MLAGNPLPPSGLVVVGPAEHDFGEHHQEEHLTHVFTLVNKTLAPLKIVEVSTSCGCLVAKKNEEPIAPGASVDLPIRFSTGAAQETASGTVQVGYRKVSDLAASDRPEYVILRVRAAVTPDYRMSPAEVDFGEINGLALEQATRIISVLPAKMPNVEINEVHCSGDFLMARILQKTTDDPAVRIQVSFDGSRLTHSQSINGSVIFSTNSKRVPKAMVYVQGRYDAPVQIEPKAIVIESSERGEAERELRVATSQSSRIRSVQRASDKGVRIEGDNQLVAREHVLRAFVAPCQEKALDCEVKVEVELFTDKKESIIRTLKVPFYRFSQKGERK